MPFALCHQDGTLGRTTKSVVLNLLEELVEVVTCLIPSTLRTVHIIDGMATEQLMKSAGTTTFGELTMKYFTSIVSPLSQSNCSEVHLVFDQYWETSIKAGERARRGTSSSLEIRINGPSTPIPKQWSKYIGNPQNKINMCDFLTSEICKIGKEKLAANKKLIIMGGYKEGERVVCVTCEVCKDLEDLHLSSDQEEADTRLLLHAKHATHPETRIIVQSPDTDVLVLCTTHFSDISREELWFRTGIRDHQQYVPVHLLCQKVGQKVCKVLPAVHALTGCDTTSALASVDKTKAWEVL